MTHLGAKIKEKKLGCFEEKKRKLIFFFAKKFQIFGLKIQDFFASKMK